MQDQIATRNANAIGILRMRASSVVPSSRPTEISPAPIPMQPAFALIQSEGQAGTYVEDESYQQEHCSPNGTLGEPNDASEAPGRYTSRAPSLHIPFQQDVAAIDYEERYANTDSHYPIDPLLGGENSLLCDGTAVQRGIKA